MKNKYNIQIIYIDFNMINIYIILLYLHNFIYLLKNLVKVDNN